MKPNVDSGLCLLNMDDDDDDICKLMDNQKCKWA